eukprot:TRINITY_DN91_c0_g1_i3.p1 TRINITY_DN91_c0_g1~~TRINITY_DN91_c0_g1_i3.p1  ORF type:complete len:366 (-),score=40.28 TRINITY_DN91_c0_g1_i3:337-1434(-)
MIVHARNLMQKALAASNGTGLAFSTKALIPSHSTVITSRTLGVGFRTPRFLSAALNRNTLSPILFPQTRRFSSVKTESSLNDPSPNWSNRPPKETILLDGCDFEHWLVVMDPPEGNPSREEIIDSYIKTLAQVVGSEEEARMKIYSVSTRHYYAFGCLVSEELSYKLKPLPHVRWVLPDSYLDPRTKDYGGEPFINGQAVPYDPKYHAEWVRNNQRCNERRSNDRPRNFDRSRNFERRREMQQQARQNYERPPPPPGSQGYAAPPPPPSSSGYPNQHPAPHSGYSNQPPPPPSGYSNAPPPPTGYSNAPPPPPGYSNAPPPPPGYSNAPPPPSGYSNAPPHPSGYLNQAPPSGYPNPPYPPRGQQ